MRWPPWLGRVVRTVVVTGFVLGATSGASRWQPGAPPMTPPAAAWLVATGLTLLLVHRFPLTIFLVTTASAFGYYASGLPGGPVILVPTIALFLLTRQRGPLTAGITGSAALAVLYLVHVVTSGSFALAFGAGFLVVWLVAVIGVGTAVRYQLDALAARREQADEHRHRLAEQERLRIAREVHDVVAHSLAMINVQAGVAAHVADRRPEQAKEALLNIKAASASALKDLRATLAVLRSGEDKAPAPSLAQAGELLDHARDAGLAVDVHGEPGDLPAPVDAAAYRILQESLTNVVRHADRPDRVDVRFERKAGTFVMKVRDDGRGTAQPTPGHGLRGMSERAAALGGRCTAGPVEGGFEVCVELPIEGGSMIRVLLADDQVLVRAGFRVLLETEDGFEVCGEAGDGEQAVAGALEHRPDIVVMDVRMPGVDGLEATRRVTAHPDLAGTKVLVLTTFDVDEYVYEALRAGASGFLLKDTEPVELLRALRVVASGEALLAPTVTRRLIQEFVGRPENRRVDTSAVREITDREREVLALVAGGMSNDEIAAHLVISTATARTHVSRIMTKIGARDRAQLVVLAYESGLVSPRRPA